MQLPEGGPVFRPRRPAEVRAAERAVANGRLERVLPGVFGPPGASAEVEARILAAIAWDPDVVVVGPAAARWWWPEIPVGPVGLARRSKTAPKPGYRFVQRCIPPELIERRGGVARTCPALTVLDLLPTHGGAAIDEALRRRALTMAGLWEVFDSLPRRPGDAARRLLLEDSRDEPWSEAERHLHRAYRASGLGYRYAANHWVRLRDGRRTALDFALPELMLAFEVDGFAHHSPRTAFEYDRERDADLAAQSWQVVRLSASSVLGVQPRLIALLCDIVAARVSMLSGAR